MKLKESAKLHISKLDAARRQLETAVRLYFSAADPVSIHTLTSAAHELLAGVNRTRGGPAMIEDSLLQWVKPDKVADARRRLRAAANFFKHADRDAEETHVFSPSQTEMRLFDAREAYRSITGELVPILAVYRLWFFLGPGADLVDPARETTIAKLRQALPATTREAFLAEALPIVSTIEV